MSDEGLKYCIFNTRMGWIGILRSLDGVQRTTLPQPSDTEARRQLGGDGLRSAAWSPDSFRDLIERFRAYFSGSNITFAVKLDLTGATPFQRAVWEANRLIPYGETRTYAWVAAQAGNPQASRAAGHALGQNPVPIIVPCHRVLGSDGSLRGFGGGLPMKQRLLDLEAGTK